MILIRVFLPQYVFESQFDICRAANLFAIGVRRQSLVGCIQHDGQMHPAVQYDSLRHRALSLVHPVAVMRAR